MPRLPRSPKRNILRWQPITYHVFMIHLMETHNNCTVFVETKFVIRSAVRNHCKRIRCCSVCVMGGGSFTVSFETCSVWMYTNFYFTSWISYLNGQDNKYVLTLRDKIICSSFWVKYVHQAMHTELRDNWW